jgi:hypothetical protein
VTAEGGPNPCGSTHRLDAGLGHGRSPERACPAASRAAGPVAAPQHARPVESTRVARYCAKVPESGVLPLTVS